LEEDGIFSLTTQGQLSGILLYWRNRPSADLQSIDIITIRTTVVLRNLPEVQFAPLDHQHVRLPQLATYFCCYYLNDTLLRFVWKMQYTGDNLDDLKSAKIVFNMPTCRSTSKETKACDYFDDQVV